MTRVEKFKEYREQIKNMRPEDFPKSRTVYKPKHAKEAERK